MKASEFVAQHGNLPPGRREERAVQLALMGEHAAWPMVPVEVANAEHALILTVAADYFALGTPTDFLRFPLTPLGAQRIADAYGWMLPTPKMVDAIWNQAEVRLQPDPWGPPFNEEMLSTYRFVEHDRRINLQLAQLEHSSERWPLLAGHKKDVVVTNKLKAGRVAIYGWHRLDGKPIQPLNATSHDAAYADYSHGARFVEQTVLLDGRWRMPIEEVLLDPKLCGLLSDEGPLYVRRQPGKGS